MSLQEAHHRRIQVGTDDAGKTRGWTSAGQSQVLVLVFNLLFDMGFPTVIRARAPT